MWWNVLFPFILNNVTELEAVAGDTHEKNHCQLKVTETMREGSAATGIDSLNLQQYIYQN